MSVVASTSAEVLEQRLLELLEAAELLAGAVAAGEEGEALAELMADREAAFRALAEASAQRASAPRAPLGPTARACLDRLEGIDRALLAAGREELARLSRERLDLLRRREVVKAHGERERIPGRAVALKA